jgi:uncharacterized protein (UPF0248 family)
MSEARKRTAREAIDRIVWDRRLDPGAFVVGYADRRAEGGVREAPLPDWLARELPAHRVRTIRCGGVVVWRRGDEADRLADADLPPEAWVAGTE